MDINYIASVFAKNNPLRFRVGTVVSVETDRTCTVTIAGDTTSISGVRYMSNVAPLPTAAVWLVTDGRDLFVLGHMAADARTLATKATRSTTQSIADSTDAYISFDSSAYNAWGAWEGVTNPARITAPLTGRYMVVATLAFAGNGTGFRRAWIESNGSNAIASVRMNAIAGNPNDMNVTGVVTLSKGDYVRLGVRQTSGGALNVNTGADLSLVYLGS